MAKAEKIERPIETSVTAPAAFEHKLVSYRGTVGSIEEAELNLLGVDGWAVVAAYAVDGGISTIPTHHFVLRRRSVKPSEEVECLGTR